MCDVIYRDDAINAVYKCPDIFAGDMPVMVVKADAYEALAQLPSAQPETSRIENALHGKSAEEQYDFIWWLLQNYAMTFTDSRQAAIEWLKGETNEQGENNT